MQSIKPPQKIRKALEHTYNIKKQNSRQINQRKTKQYGCVDTIQNAKSKQAKNLHYLFSHNTIKKARNKTQEKSKAKY